MAPKALRCRASRELASSRRNSASAKRFRRKTGRGTLRPTARGPMITLKTVMERYNSLATRPGAAVALEAFGLSRDEAEKLFTDLDEDYHISRHLHFSKMEGRVYRISGEDVTNVAIDPAISTLL